MAATCEEKRASAPKSKARVRRDENSLKPLAMVSAAQRRRYRCCLFSDVVREIAPGTKMPRATNVRCRFREPGLYSGYAIAWSKWRFWRPPGRIFVSLRNNSNSGCILQIHSLRRAYAKRVDR